MFVYISWVFDLLLVGEVNACLFILWELESRFIYNFFMNSKVLSDSKSFFVLRELVKCQSFKGVPFKRPWPFYFIEIFILKKPEGRKKEEFTHSKKQINISISVTIYPSLKNFFSYSQMAFFFFLSWCFSTKHINSTVYHEQSKTQFQVWLILIRVDNKPQIAMKYLRFFLDFCPKLCFVCGKFMHSLAFRNASGLEWIRIFTRFLSTQTKS